MGRIGIDYQAVANAISELQGKQKNLTVDNIREVLGTGSKTTIARLLREWKSEQELAKGMDAGMPVELQHVIKGLWGSLQEKAEQRVIDYQHTADEKITQAQQEAKEALTCQTDLQSQMHKLEEQLNGQTNENTQIKNALNTATNENAKLSEQLKSLESHHQDSQAENERLHQLLANMQNNIEHYQNSIQSLQQEQSLLLEKQRSEYEQKNHALQQALDVEKQQKIKLESKVAQQSDMLTEIKGKYKQKSEEADHIKHELSSWQAKNKHLEQANQEISEKYQQYENQYFEKSSALTTCESELKFANKQVQQLNASLLKSEIKIQALEAEKIDLTQKASELIGQLKFSGEHHETTK